MTILMVLKFYTILMETRKPENLRLAIMLIYTKKTHLASRLMIRGK